MISGFFLLVAVLAIVFGGTLLGLAYLRVLGSNRSQRQLLPTPENVLRDRYARGEIGRQAYLDALADVLKDRYVRDELTAEEYEERLDVLLLPEGRKTGSSGRLGLPPNR